MANPVTTAHFTGATIEAEFGGGSFIGVSNVGINAGWDLMIPVVQLSQLQSLVDTAVSTQVSQQSATFTLKFTNSGGRASVEIGYVGGVGSELIFLATYLSEFNDLLVAMTNASPPEDYEGNAKVPFTVDQVTALNTQIGTALAVSTDGTQELPVPTGVGLELVILASGLEDIRFNGVSL